MAEEDGLTNQLDPAATDAPGENSRDGARKRRDPNEPAAVVGLGASAGGVGVLQQFFTDMPANSGLAFVVVMHLSPEYESQLPNVLQQKTRMPVTQVNEPVKVQPNHVYVIPPNHQLTFEDSMLRLVEPQQALGKRVTIDLFFRTLAQAYGQRAVCVILSGSDSDGVIGLKHVRAQGGLTIVQDPNEAEHDSMPLNAIATGMVDWVLPVGKMTPKLLDFVHNENRMQLPPEIPEAEEADAKVKDAPGGETVSDETRRTEDETAIGEVLSYVRAQTGHDFSHYKRATVLRRIARRLQVNSIETIPQYLEFLRTHASETRALLQDLLIGVTHFFRDRTAFASLEAQIPQLFAGKKRDDQIRVWVAGCATGEEAYSIAMLLREHCARLTNPPAVQIFATDIDEQAIADAREGIYPAMIEADISPERLREFFSRDHGRYRVRKELREKVLFAVHNVLKDAPFSRVDLVSCRNLMIYLKQTAQAQVFDIFHFALRSGGLLFIGGSENQTQSHSLFSPVDAKQRIFVRRSTPRPAWKVPLLPVRAATRPRQPPGARMPPMTQDAAAHAIDNPEASSSTGHARREVLFGELHLRLLEEYGPPSVVVNDTQDILHISESAGRYLRFPAGEPTANAVKAVHPALQTELRTALFKAAQTKETVRGMPQNVEMDGGADIVTLEVRPMRATDTAHGFYLVLFQRESDNEKPAVAAPAHVIIAGEANEEIQYLKEQLGSTVEQYEAANEELKASNEELQAMNEEMRSATEELETSKEELQSVNEELTTVNHELKASVEELSHTNADLNNLMSSTDIGTIFLDRQLRIHRFTPSAQKVFNLLPADLDRPISDITTRLHYEGFLEDLEKAMQDLQTIEREVRVDDSDDWYLSRVAPYRTGDDRIAGVVATFINITRRKHAEEELRQSEGRVRRAMEVETVGIIFFTLDGRITDANDAFLSMTGYSREDLERGRVRWDKMTPPEWMKLTREEMERVSRTGKIGPYEKQYIRKDGTRWWGLFTGTKLGDDFGVEYILDISDKRAGEEALRQSEERFRNVADNVPQIIWTNEPGGKVNYFNRRWYDYTGLSTEESMGPERQQIIHPGDAAPTIEQWQQALAEGKTFSAEYRMRGHDGEYRWFIGRNVPLRDDGKILGWFGTATDIHDSKEAEAALRESEERFRLLVEGTPDYAMFLMDPDTTITYWSKGAEKVFGWTAREAVGRNGNLIFTPEDKAKGVVKQEIGLARENGFAPDQRWHLRKDGSRLWVDGVMRRVDNVDGSLRGFAKIARDATQRQEIEAALRHAKDEMEQRVLERTRDLVATNNELERTMAQRQQLEREILEISEREKRRIGQDLHDIVCQELTAAALFLKSNANRSVAKNPAAAKTLTEAAEIVNRNVTLARNLARGFQPVKLSGGEFTAAMRALISQANRSRSLHCRLEMPQTIELPDESMALNIYRIAQEALTNAIKHAGAKQVIVSLKKNRGILQLTVEDDGKGFQKKKRSKGLGLHIMDYRASVLGGTFSLETTPKGTRVLCTIPLHSQRGKR